MTADTLETKGNRFQAARFAFRVCRLYQEKRRGAADMEKVFYRGRLRGHARSLCATRVPPYVLPAPLTVEIRFQRQDDAAGAALTDMHGRPFAFVDAFTRGCGLQRHGAFLSCSVIF